MSVIHDVSDTCEACTFIKIEKQDLRIISKSWKRKYIKAPSIFEIINQPILRVEHDGDLKGLRGKNVSTMNYKHFFIDQAQKVYGRRIRMQSFPFMLRHSPVSMNYIDIVYPQRDYAFTYLENSDKIWKNVKTMSNQTICLGSKIVEDSRSRPFSPIPPEFKKGDIIYGSYFGSGLLSKNFPSYQHDFNDTMIGKRLTRDACYTNTAGMSNSSPEACSEKKDGRNLLKLNKSMIQTIF